MKINKKLKGFDAHLFRSIFEKGKSTLIELDGQKFLVKPIQSELEEEIESDIELKKMLEESKISIAKGETYSTKNVLDLIERGDI